jgi:hypothetical protein
MKVLMLLWFALEATSHWQFINGSLTEAEGHGKSKAIFS